MNALELVLLRDAAWRHADGADPTGIFFENLHPCDLALAQRRAPLGVAKHRPSGPGNGIARLVLATGNGQFYIGAHLRFGQACLHLNRNQRMVGLGQKRRQAVADMAVDRGGAIVAACRHARIAGVIGAAIDHALADPIHLGPIHIGQPRHGL